MPTLSHARPALLALVSHRVSNAWLRAQLGKVWSSVPAVHSAPPPTIPVLVLLGSTATALKLPACLALVPALQVIARTDATCAAANFIMMMTTMMWFSRSWLHRGVSPCHYAGRLITTGRTEQDDFAGRREYHHVGFPPMSRRTYLQHNARGRSVVGGSCGRSSQRRRARAPARVCAQTTAYRAIPLSCLGGETVKLRSSSVKLRSNFFDRL